MSLNRIKESAQDRVITYIILLVVTLIVIVIAYPLYFVIIASLTDQTEIAAGRVWLWPSRFNLKGYQKILEYSRLWLGYRNTILYATAGTVISLSATMPAGYALSRKDFFLRNPFMAFFVITMFFSGGMIPTYYIVQKLGLIDTVWALMVPGCVSTYNLILVRTFFQTTIPQELHEAAVLDGASDGRIFIKIVLPLSSAILAVIGLYSVVSYWNSFFPALIYLRYRTDLTPLQLVLRDVLILNTLNEQSDSTSSGMEAKRLQDLIKYGCIVVSTLPVMVLYPFLQKYFDKGVMIGAIKG